MVYVGETNESGWLEKDSFSCFRGFKAPVGTGIVRITLPTAPPNPMVATVGERGESFAGEVGRAERNTTARRLGCIITRAIGSAASVCVWP